MRAIAIEVETIWRAPGSADASGRLSPLRRLARAAIWRILEALVPPGAPPPSPADETDWPRFPGF